MEGQKEKVASGIGNLIGAVVHFDQALTNTNWIKLEERALVVTAAGGKVMPKPKAGSLAMLLVVTKDKPSAQQKRDMRALMTKTGKLVLLDKEEFLRDIMIQKVRTGAGGGGKEAGFDDDI
jgi:hypothetical protein